MKNISFCSLRIFLTRHNIFYSTRSMAR